MAIPATIPAGFLAHCNYTTKKPVQYDHKNYVNTLPVPDQAFVDPTGVVMENRRIALNSGPRSYFEHTLNGTTVEKTILT